MEFIDTIRGAKNTRKTYLSLFNNHIEAMYTAFGEEAFTHESMFKACTRWEKSLSPRTIKMLLILAQKMARYYKAEDIFDMKQLVGDFCHTQQSVPKALSAEKASALMRRAKEEGQEFYVAVLLGLHAGLRVSEAVSLTAADISGEWLLVGHSATTKNRQGRKLRMSGTLRHEIAKLNIKEGKLIKVTACTINRKLRAIAGVSFHTCRHSYASLALEAGVSPKLVQQSLGHKSLVTTLDTYWNSCQDGMTDFNFLPEVI